MSIFRTVPADEDARYRKWTGAYKPYDLVKEASVAVGVVTLLAVVLTILFSSPDDPSATVQSWAKHSPADFSLIAANELGGTSASSGYGPPYNHAADGQHIAFVYPAKWLGVSHPLDPTQDFVILPLRAMRGVPAVQAAVNAWQAAPPSQQQKWTTNFENAIAKTRTNSDGTLTIPPGDYGPVRTMMTALLADAQAGGLDGQLLASRQFYQTDYTKILMFLADDNGAGATTTGSGYFNNLASDQNLLGGQWGMMNETGQFPGQVWLWLYTFWYQVKPFSDPGTVFGQNADLYVMAIMAILSLCLIVVPFFPIINRIPRWIPIYKLVWREHYRSLAKAPPPPPPVPSQTPARADRAALG